MHYCPSCGWAMGYEVTTLARPRREFIGECGHRWHLGDDPWAMMPVRPYTPREIYVIPGSPVAYVQGVSDQITAEPTFTAVSVHHGPAAPYPAPPTADELMEYALGWAL